MIEKPSPSDFVLWRRSPCTQWLLEQLSARYDHAGDWTTVKSLEIFNVICGHQEVVDFVKRET